MDCSIGIMACNEEKNIGRLLAALGSQRLENARIAQIVVVAGGCSDRTCEITEEAARRDPRIQLIIEPCRRGKAAAINTFLQIANCEICVLQGADTYPDKNTIERLVSPLSGPAVGITGARVVPLNPSGTLAGYTVHFLWRIHHEISMLRPKCGELIAFRRVFDSIPEDTIVDEPQIEALVRDSGLTAVYAHDAIVFNLGPATVREIIMRRRSIVRGYLELSRRTERRSSTQARGAVARIVIGSIFSGRESLLFAPAAICIEIIARALGRIDFHFSRKPGHIWPMAGSSKELPQRIGGE